MTNEDVKKEVEKAVDEVGAGPSPADTPEIVPPEGVKPEVEPTAPVVDGKTPAEKVEDVKNIKDEGKLQEQISNLNAALKVEREAGKGHTTKMTELEEQLSTANETIGKLRDVFVPKEDPVPAEPEVFTKEQAEQMWEDRKKVEIEESTIQIKAAKMKEEIAELEKVWDGVEGKPSYKDDEVLEWQKENSKLYLTPKEAFSEMQHNEIVDWEVKQRSL